MGKIEENQQYKSGSGMFSVTVPAASNSLTRTYNCDARSVKDENHDFEEVVFYMNDSGEAYGTGVRRIPKAVQAQMAKDGEKQTLSNLAKKALFQWRNDFAEEPQATEEYPVQTQFGGGLLRVYLAKRSSLMTRASGSDIADKATGGKFDAYMAVIVVRQDDWFVYATAEDDFLQIEPGGLASEPAHPSSSADRSKTAFVLQPVLQSVIRNFFASMKVSALRTTVPGS